MKAIEIQATKGLECSPMMVMPEINITFFGKLRIALSFGYDLNTPHKLHAYLGFSKWSVEAGISLFVPFMDLWIGGAWEDN